MLRPSASLLQLFGGRLVAGVPAAADLVLDLPSGVVDLVADGVSGIVDLVLDAGNRAIDPALALQLLVVGEIAGRLLGTALGLIDVLTHFDRLLYRSQRGYPPITAENGRDSNDAGRDDQCVSKTVRDRLSQDDAQILRLESAAIKGHTGKVLVAAPDSQGRGLSVDRLRDQVAARMAAFPRLSQRVEEPRFGLGRPAWIEVPEVDLDWHVAQPDHADPLSDEELRRAVGDLLSERLDHTRPLWRFDALPLTGDRTALVGRIHHAMAD